MGLRGERKEVVGQRAKQKARSVEGWAETTQGGKESWREEETGNSLGAKAQQEVPVSGREAESSRDGGGRVGGG